MQINDEIKAAVVAFLNRFSPPRSIASNPQAMADEVIQITETVARYAPRSGFNEWWQRVGSAIVQRMKTRAWPLVSEVEAACRIEIEADRNDGSASQDMIEAAAIDRLESWFRKFGNQAPSQGKPSRTMALIRRGVLQDLRHARFCGFDLTNDQMEQARDIPMGRDEASHNRRVLDDLAAIGRHMAPHGEEFAAKRATVKPEAGAA